MGEKSYLPSLPLLKKHGVYGRSVIRKEREMRKLFQIEPHIVWET
jgi:hypothetical protein